LKILSEERRPSGRDMENLSIVISTPDARFPALALRGDFPTSIKTASELGYQGVELAIRDPKLVDEQQIKALIKTYNLKVPALGTGQAYGQEGLSFSHPSKEIRERAKERIYEQIKFARRFKSLVIIGLIRGKTEKGVRKEQAKAWVRENLIECARFGQKRRVALVIEPLNRYETDLVNTLKEGLELIKEVGEPNIFLLADTFHMNIEEEDIIRSLVEAKDYLKHIHLADSNRLFPGSGHLNFAEIISTLKEVGYQGFFSLEILPRPSPYKSAKYGIEYLKEIKFKTYKNPALTVDVIIEYPDNSIVLIKRLNPPFKGRWALPGGFVEYGERVESAALREAEEETGLKVKLEELLGVYSDPKRDPRGHTVSVIFKAKPVGGKLKAASDAKEVKRVKKIRLSQLAFDHHQILKEAGL